MSTLTQAAIPAHRAMDPAGDRPVLSLMVAPAVPARDVEIELFDAAIRTVEAVVGVPRHHILSRSRTSVVSLARNLLYRICVEEAGITQTRAGKLIGSRNHGTVAWGIRSVTAWAEGDGNIAGMVTAAVLEYRRCLLALGIHRTHGGSRLVADWRSASDELPDADTLVIACNRHTEDLWFASCDGERWVCESSGQPLTVTHWKHAPDFPRS